MTHTLPVWLQVADWVVAGLWLCLGACALWLGTALDRFASQPATSKLVPQLMLTRGYPFVALVWLWTDGHKALGDKTTTRLVLAGRILMGAAVLLLLALSIVQPDIWRQAPA